MMLAQIKWSPKHQDKLLIPILLNITVMDDTAMAASILSNLHECYEQMKIVANYPLDNTEENVDDACESSDPCSEKTDQQPIVDYIDLSSHSHPYLDLNVSNSHKHYCKKTFHELNKYSPKQLQVLLEDLSQYVEQVSSELVQLLLENDSLQQETDARNIAIEQLLKMTVKVNESDLKPIQMSVVLPDENCDDV